MKTTLYRRDKTYKAKRKAWSVNANAKRLRNIVGRHKAAMAAIDTELAEDTKRALLKLSILS